MGEGPARLILASGSRTRREMLAHAGLAFTVEPAPVDEAALCAAMLSVRPAPGAAAIAVLLARAKAEAVSRLSPDALVIGADQTLALGSDILEKAPNVEAAGQTLRRLRGKTHELHSAVALAERGLVTWSLCATARMTMRAFSDDFLAQYLVRAQDRVSHSVGAYEFEGLGAQLFERFEGDFTTILGLPLLPLLAELRARGVIAS